MARVLLDTQIVYLAYRGEMQRMPVTVRDLLGDPDTVRLISSVSMIEIAVKHTIGKLDMGKDALQAAIRDLRLTELAFEPEHAFAMFSLPLLHRDPFDRMLLATALAEKLPIVTGERVFRRYSRVQVIW